MKQLAKKMLLVGALVAASSSASAFDFDGVCPYVGIDYQQRWMNPESASDRGLVGADAAAFNALRPRNTYPGLTAYIGARCDCIGFELGYDASFRNRKNWTIDPFNGNVTSQLNGGHLDLVTFWPVMDCTEFVLAAGIGFLQPKVTVRNNTTGLTTTYSGRTSGVGRVRAGINYLFTDCIGARALLGYETTHALRTRVSNVANAEILHPFQDSFTLSLGLFYKF